MKGVCQCLPGYTLCDGVCVDLKADWGHCGGCGKKCGLAQLCQKGSCQDSPSCKDPAQRICNGGCVDFSTNVLHCGKCGNRCAAGFSCIAGICRSGQEGGFSESIGDAGPESIPEKGPEQAGPPEKPIADNTQPTTVLKCSPNCNLVAFGGVGDDFIHGGALWLNPKTRKEYLYAVGQLGKPMTIPKSQLVSGKVDLSLGVLGKSAAFTFKMELSSQKYLWANAVPGAGNIVGRAIAVDLAGSACFVGSFDTDIALSQGSVKSQGGEDAFFAVLSGNSGQPIVDGVATGSGVDLMTDVAFIGNNTFYIAGNSSSPKFFFNSTSHAGPYQARNGPSDLFGASVVTNARSSYLAEPVRIFGSVNAPDSMGAVASIVSGAEKSKYSLGLLGTFGRETMTSVSGFLQSYGASSRPQSQSIGVSVVDTTLQTSRWELGADKKPTLFSGESHPSSGVDLALDGKPDAPDTYVLGSFSNSFAWKFSPSSKLQVNSSFANKKIYFVSKIANGQGVQAKKPSISWITQVNKPVSTGGTFVATSIALRKGASGKEVYVTGYFSGAVSIGGTILTSSGVDSFVAVLSGGSFVAYQLGCQATCRATKILVGLDGIVHVLGSFTGRMKLGKNVINSSGNKDGFVLSFKP